MSSDFGGRKQEEDHANPARSERFGRKRGRVISPSPRYTHVVVGMG